ncbi:homeobox protein Mohawk isoform X3 [Drosophila sechellia]|uniref:homeobox protein Mohawk isoform X3 n=1 Tax=Drosophila sechellia TaxID=7238 RepID=UPI0013DD9443|nr:homeobox protein Mohawk isoform X3 [Drosophila sechellia]
MDKSTRPKRNRRHSRRAWPPEEELHPASRATKRLFTPDIKRMLKDWLIRRRENPYPSREEKKQLAAESGLTYTQICNWFANWRRKLKNSEREKAKKSWGHLIKNYNHNARGNVEQFSISSEDSIWEEEMHSCPGEDDEGDDNDEFSSHSTGSADQTERIPILSAQTGGRAKYKHQMMEKYLRDSSPAKTTSQQGTQLNKWLESAAKFTPDRNNYHIEWNMTRKLAAIAVVDKRSLPQMCLGLVVVDAGCFIIRTNWKRQRPWPTSPSTAGSAGTISKD